MCRIVVEYLNTGGYLNAELMRQRGLLLRYYKCSLLNEIVKNLVNLMWKVKSNISPC